ncbi:type III toxin-antitoxin system CptIN family toxin [Selenomonas noxia]|uniref:type III toxin-antitoxin system CptIN family toxin n=1 Tax=Selenomonas noxia TaxID=135083 RepID=UPI0028D723ED|nr:hypothetical protein [Selenomonas noxia]
MNADSLYFLKDQYFIDFPDPRLMKSHERTATGLHGRPCFFCMRDKKDKDILWMIPLSSKLTKFKAILASKTARYGECDTIVIGKVLGSESAFLLQNMCPVTDKYIDCEYTPNGKTVQLAEGLKNELHKKAERVLETYTFRSKKVIFPDVEKIKKELLCQLARDRAQENTHLNAGQAQQPKKRRPVMRKKNTSKDQQHGR